MQAANRARQRLGALAIAGLLLFNFPLLSLPTGEITGLPGPFLYLFGSWGLLIALAALLAESKDR